MVGCAAYPVNTYRAVHDLQHGCNQLWLCGQLQAQGDWRPHDPTEHPLAHRHMRDDGWRCFQRTRRSSTRSNTFGLGSSDHALANFCPKSLAELKDTARDKLRSGQRRQSIITACWKQAELW